MNFSSPMALLPRRDKQNPYRHSGRGHQPRVTRGGWGRTPSPTTAPLSLANLQGQELKRRRVATPGRRSGSASRAGGSGSSAESPGDLHHDQIGDRAEDRE